MAEQKLYLKLITDTNGLKTITQDVDALSASQKRLLETQTKSATANEKLKVTESELLKISQAITEVKQTQIQNEAKLAATVDRLNNSQINSGLALYNANRALTSYERTASQTATTLAGLNKQFRDLELAKGALKNAEASFATVSTAASVTRAAPEAGTFSYATGSRLPVVDISAATAQMRAKEEAETRAFLSRRERMEAEANDKLLAAEKLANDKREAETKAFLRRREQAEQEHAAAMAARAPQATADSRGYTAFASGFAGENRAKHQQELSELAALELAEKQKLLNQTLALQERARLNTAAQFKQETADSLAEINRRVELENTVRRFGADSKQAIAVRAAQEELRIRENLANKLASIEQRIASGNITKAQGSVEAEAAMNRASTAILNNSKVLDNNEQAVKRTSVAHKGLATHIAEVVSIYTIFNSAISLVKQAMLDIPKAGIQQEQTQASIFAIFGSKEGYKNLELLKELSKSAGQYIGDLQEAYARFAPSAVLAGATQADVNKVFKDFTETSTVLHLGTSEVKSLYLALEQMYAKTTVQSEEIKKQLGNVLPGAVEVGAKAWENYINKGKEGSERTKVSVADFMDAMKKNLVISKNFIPEFSEVYRKAFAGPDDSVFLDTRTKLLSNLQRLRSDYFEISTEIYKRTSDSLNNIVKLAAEALETVQKNATGVLQVIEMLSIAIAARLSGSLLTGLVTNINKVSVLLTGMSAGALAVASATATAALSVSNLSLKYEEARGILVAYNSETASITSVLEVALSDAQKLLVSYLESYRGFGSDFLKAILPDPTKAITDFFKQYVPLTLGYLKAVKQAFSDEGLTLNLGATAKQFAQDYANQFDEYGASVVTRAIEKDVNNLKTYVKGKPVYDVGKEISAQLAAGLKLSTADITAMLESGLDIAAPKAGDTENAVTKNLKKSAADAKEAYKAAFEEIKTAYGNISNDVKEALSNIDTMYKQNAMSIADYFTQKKSLQETDIAVQREMLDQELQLAFAQKDKVKIGKLQNEIVKLNTEANRENAKTIQERTAAEREYLALTLAGEAKVLEYQGKAGEAAIKQFDIATRDKFEKFAIAGDTTALRNLEIERQNVGLKGKLADINQEIGNINETYNASIERTNILLNTGAISELTSLKMLTEARQRKIEEMEKEIALQEKAIQDTEATGAPVDIKESRALRRMKQELENFKLTSDAVAMHFEKVFGDAFDGAFQGLVEGTMTGRQAFASFSKSIISEINKMIAAELRSAILRPLMNAAFSGIGGMFSGVFGSLFGSASGTISAAKTGVAGLGNAQLVAPVSKFTGTYLANGGVMTGPGISAHSGTIVSSPTIFPFAKGTGLMGEAGPEAILPLKRNAKGKLGVSLDNGGQSGGNVYNIAVSVESVKGEKPEDTGNRIAEAMMRSIAKQEIATASRPGNILNRTTKFG